MYCGVCNSYTVLSITVSELNLFRERVLVLGSLHASQSQCIIDHTVTDS